MKNLNEIKKRAEYCLNCKTRPCTKGCPLGNKIPDFIKYIKEEEYKEAFNILSKTTVLQPICGRICPHYKQCQGNCVRGINGAPVSIGKLEAFIGDMAIEENWKIGSDVDFEDVQKHSLSLTKSTNGVTNIDEDANNIKKVAVVGSGPTGLTCAAFLARKGYSVTIYEKHDKLGGLLRYGIPDFRLDREVLNVQINKILDLGINVVYGKELGKDFDLNYLRSNYDAVFLGLGANISRKMNIPGENLKGVFGGNELLENGIHPSYNGKKVAIIGGGNVAMDVSRTIKRLGADKVYVIYRRAEEQMPAEKKEITDAKNEGIEFLFQNNIVRINGKYDENNSYSGNDIDVTNTEDCVSCIECIKTELVQKEGSDRLVPVDIDGSNFVMDMDYVVMAVGAEVENSVISGLGIKLNKWGYIDVNENFMTSIPNVFAGGDIVGTEATVAWAARNGRDAAKEISKKLENMM